MQVMTAHPILTAKFAPDGSHYLLNAEPTIESAANLIVDVAVKSNDGEAAQHPYSELVSVSLDLVNSGCVRAFVVNMPHSRRQGVLVVVHHIVSDARSLALLCTELCVAYEQQQGGADDVDDGIRCVAHQRDLWFLKYTHLQAKEDARDDDGGAILHWTNCLLDGKSHFKPTTIAPDFPAALPSHARRRCDALGVHIPAPDVKELRLMALAQKTSVSRSALRPICWH